MICVDMVPDADARSDAHDVAKKIDRSKVEKPFHGKILDYCSFVVSVPSHQRHWHTAAAQCNHTAHT